MGNEKDTPMLEGTEGLEVLEEAGVAFDPTSQHLDLTKNEKRRTTALMLAIQGYKELIIKDAMMLREVADTARRGEGPKIQAATIDAMVEAAWKFDMFIAGVPPDEMKREAREHPLRDGGPQTEAETESPPANEGATA